ncbi:MAG: arylsulfatase [Planctomycetota bacterium]|jgi:arylsulfatase
MKQHGFFMITGVAAIMAGMLARADAAQSADRPNVVILFADDLGYSDIGCFGGEIETPHLDRLAAGGVRFSQFYNAGRCCPARASLLTGLYPHQAGVGMMVYRNWGEGYQGYLNQRCVTFAEVLGAAGYQTMMTGKWHTGHVPESRPEVRGFDHFTGVYLHIDSYWKVLRNCDVYRDGKLLIPAQENPVNPYHPDQEFYTTDFFTDATVDYINRALDRPDQPFLIHVCYNAPHFPLEAPDELIEKYRGRYLAGWDELRREKLARMKEMGLLPRKQLLPQVNSNVSQRVPNLPFKALVDSDPLPEWDELGRRDQEELDFRRAMYAAQVDRLDQNVGRIIECLEKRGALDNTVIMFFSDNGCSGELGLFGMNWHQNKSANYDQWRKASGWSISQGQCWATYSNTPLRKYKQYVHEGGIASPFIAHWPKGIPEGGRIVSDQVFHLVDVMPTLCELAGTEYPGEYQGRRLTPNPGISMVPYWKGRVEEPERRTLYWQHMNHSAVRDGDWKLVTLNDRDQLKWELYNLSEDRSEMDNIIAQHPEVARELQTKWHAWATEVNVLPFPEERDEDEPNHPSDVQAK